MSDDFFVAGCLLCTLACFVWAFGSEVWAERIGLLGMILVAVSFPGFIAQGMGATQVAAETCRTEQYTPDMRHKVVVIERGACAED